MNDVEKAIIRKMADHSLNVKSVADDMYMCRNTVVYHLEKIKKKTGLNPRNFHNLIRLQEMIGRRETNYEQIKSMTIDELARFVQDISGDVEKYIPFCKSKTECTEMLDKNMDIPEGLCCQCIKEWLLLEVEE